MSRPRSRGPGRSPRRVHRHGRGSGHEVEHVASDHGPAQGVGSVVDEDHHAVAGQPREPPELLVEGKPAEREGFHPGGPRLDELQDEPLDRPVEGRGAADEHHAAGLRVEVESHADRPLALEHREGSGRIRRQLHPLDHAPGDVEEDQGSARKEGRPVLDGKLEGLGALRHHGVEALAPVLLLQEIGELLGVANDRCVREVEVLHVEIDGRPVARLERVAEGAFRLLYRRAAQGNEKEDAGRARGLRRGRRRRSQCRESDPRGQRRDGSGETAACPSSSSQDGFSFSVIPE